jgi:hypothetical protein
VIVEEFDNLRQAPSRSLGVTSGDLERALRESLSRAANPSHAVGEYDPAGRAVRKARRIGRRRSAAGAVLLVMAMAVVTVGVARLNPEGQRQAGPAWDGDVSPPEKVGPVILETPTPGLGVVIKGQTVDLVLAGQLRTVSGKVLDLTPLGSVSQAHETDGGWLVVGGGEAGDATLWFVTPDGERHELLQAMDSIVLAPDGRRIAWRDSARLFSAIVDKGQVKDARQVFAPAQGLPVSFVGDGVVMARGVSDPTVRGYDVWWPDKDKTYEPTWREEAAGIYGPLPNGSMVVGQVSGTTTGRPCLALFDAAKALTVLKTACALQFRTDGLGAVSPDGRWLVADGTTADTAMLVDLETAFTPSSTGAQLAGPGMAGPGTWTDNSTLVHPASDGTVVTVRAAARPKVERTAVPGAAEGTKVLVVARAALR